MQKSSRIVSPVEGLSAEQLSEIYKAFYIDLDKIEHTDTYVRYKYYNRPDNVGIVEFDFVTEKFTEIEAAPDDPNGHMFERTAMKIAKHWKKVSYLIKLVERPDAANGSERFSGQSDSECKMYITAPVKNVEILKEERGGLAYIAGKNSWDC